MKTLREENAHFNLFKRTHLQRYFRDVEPALMKKWSIFMKVLMK